jgi:AGZA family xanthine/uracil permease-like MFS transporter
MPLAFSISEGVAFGLLTYVGLRIGTGKAKEVGLITYILAFLFILHFLFGR